MRKQNKGEWSEYTTKIEILGNKSIRVVDYENDTENTCVVRSLQVSNKKYMLLGKSIYETTTIDGEANSRFVAFNDEIQEKLDVIHRKVKNGRGSFSVVEAEQLADKLGIDTATDYSHNKGDVFLEYLEASGHVSKPQAFSLKSFVGNNPTIMNASVNSTRIKLRITGLSDEKMMALKNQNMRVRENINAILESGGNYRLVSFSDTLGANLGKLNAQKQVVFAVISHFRKKEKGASKMEFIESQSQECKKVDFKLAMKRVLRAALVGMMPSEHWSGVATVSDKMLIKQPDGSCVAFLGKGALESYLYNFCYIDTPSQSKHKYGHIYKEGNEWFIDLNFQIRLAKSKV